MVNPQPPTPSTRENKTESLSVRHTELLGPMVPYSSQLWSLKDDGGGGAQQPALRGMLPAGRRVPGKPRLARVPLPLGSRGLPD